MLPFAAFTGSAHQDFLLSGGRPAALLIHGFPGTPYEMRPLAEVLNQNGWTCRGILLPGFGAQIETLPYRSWSEWRDACVEAFVALKRDHAPVLLVGHSMGAAVALAAANCEPVDGMILLAPYWRSRGILWAFLPVLKHLVPRVKPFKLMKTEMDDPRLRREIQDFLPELDLEDPKIQQAIREFVVPIGILDELRKAGTAGSRAAPAVTCPALVIQGTKDETTHLSDTRALARRLAGRVDLVEIPAAHELPFAVSPSFSRVRELVIDFACKIAGSRQTPQVKIK